MEWLLLGFANLVCAFVCLCIQSARKKTAYGVVVSLVILFCPVVSIILLLLSALIHRTFFRKLSEKLNPKDLSFKKERVELVVAANIRQDIQMVPIEEALIVSDKFSKREAILNVLKQDYSDSLDTIKNAVGNWDSEIAHYAATTISDVIERFKTGEIQLREQFEKEPCPENVSLYVKFVADFLEYQLLSDFEFRKYVLDFSDFFKDLRDVYYECFSVRECNRMLSLLINCKEYKAAKEWIEYLFFHCEPELDTYKNGLNYYYVQADYENFMKLLKEMKDSSLILDSEAIEWIRFCIV